MGIKTYQEKNKKPMKKDLAQSDLGVTGFPKLDVFLENSQNPPEMLLF